MAQHEEAAMWAASGLSYDRLHWTLRRLHSLSGIVPIGFSLFFHLFENAYVTRGGVADCGNAQNCVEVCPKEIPLTTAIGQVGRQASIKWLRDLFLK